MLVYPEVSLSLNNVCYNHCQKVSKLLLLFVSLISDLRFLIESLVRQGLNFVFSLKVQLVNILVFVGHIFSVETIQFCCCRVKETIDNI